MASLASAGGYGESDCAVLTSGRVDCWGYGYYGDLGNGTFYTTGNEGSATPVAVWGSREGRTKQSGVCRQFVAVRAICDYVKLMLGSESRLTRTRRHDVPAIWAVVIGVGLLWFIFMPLLRVINPMRVNADGNRFTGLLRRWKVSVLTGRVVTAEMRVHISGFSGGSGGISTTHINDFRLHLPDGSQRAVSLVGFEASINPGDMVSVAYVKGSQELGLSDPQPDDKSALAQCLGASSSFWTPTVTGGFLCG